MELYSEVLQLANHIDDDLALIFGWTNVEEFVHPINGALPDIHAPPFPLPLPVSVGQFKAIILDHARSDGAAILLGTSPLPCTSP